MSNVLRNTLFKILYLYGLICGMLNFKITQNNRIKYSHNLHIFSISYRIVSSLGLAIFLPDTLMNMLRGHQRPNVWAIHVMHMFIIYLYSVILLGWQVFRYQKFNRLLSEVLELLRRIQEVTNENTIFGNEVYLILVFRVLCDACALLGDIPKFMDVVIQDDFYFPLLWLFVYSEAIGALLLLDILVLGYLLSSGMYRMIGKHMLSFGQRIRHSEVFPMTNFRQMLVLCEFSDELDECSAIYWRIHRLLGEFHVLFQFNVLFVLVGNLIMIFSYVHQNFLVFINTGEIVWGNVIFGVIRIFDFLMFMLVIELISQRSRIPSNLNLDTWYSDIDPRWDRSVDQFLTQLRLQEFKLDVYGLFLLNNELCLTVFSLIVAYLTILIQFTMMGY